MDLELQSRVEGAFKYGVQLHCYCSLQLVCHVNLTDALTATTNALDKHLIATTYEAPFFIHAPSTAATASRRQIIEMIKRFSSGPVKVRVYQGTRVRQCLPAQSLAAQ